MFRKDTVSRSYGEHKKVILLPQILSNAGCQCNNISWSLTKIYVIWHPIAERTLVSWGDLKRLLWKYWGINYKHQNLAWVWKHLHLEFLGNNCYYAMVDSFFLYFHKRLICSIKMRFFIRFLYIIVGNWKINKQ